MANDIEIFQGNDRQINVTIQDAAGAAFNLTGATIYFNVKELPTDAISLIEKDSDDASEIVINSPPTLGTIKIYLVPEDTEELLGDYVYDITVEVASGKIYTIVKAKFVVVDPVK